MEAIAASATRVRDRSAAWINDRIRLSTSRTLAYYSANPEQISLRLRELDEEWEIERWLQLNSAVLSLAGITLGLLHDKRWLLLTATVQGFFLQHALQGWCPPLPLLRRLGFRTAAEIERERRSLVEVRRAYLKRFPGLAKAGGATARTDGEGEQYVRTAYRPEVAYSEAENDRRRRELEREWDVDRVLECAAPIHTLLGMLLGLRVDRRLFALPVLEQGLMVLFAVRRFSPLVSFLKGRGLRTPQEIAADLVALEFADGSLDSLLVGC